MTDMTWFGNRAENTFRRYVKPRFAGKPTWYLEIGVWTGQSLVWMLEHVLTHPRSYAFAVDAWLPLWTKKRQWTAEQVEENYQETLQWCEPYRDKVEIIRSMSGVWLRQCDLPKHSLDMVYLDGEHTAVGVMDDLALTWPLLKPGGLLLFDDYFRDKHKWHSVKSVVDAVMPAVYGPYIEQVCLTRNQIGFIKTGDAKLVICQDARQEESQLVGVSTR